MKYIQDVINNNTITLARACLALSVLGTLLFTPMHDLFPDHHIANIAANGHRIGKINLFFLFDNIYIGYTLAVGILVLVIAGVMPRITCWLHTWVTYSYFFGILIVEGGDQINAILTLLLIPICVLDSRINGWKNKAKKNTLPDWLQWNAHCAIIFIGLQMAILYLNAGVAKTFATEWYNGTAIYYWINDNMFGAPEWLQMILAPIIEHPIGVSLLNWGVIALEVCLFIVFFLPQRFKYLFFLIGVLFHFSIVMIHGLTAFWLAMTGGLVLYLLRLDLSLSDNWKNIGESLKTIFSIPEAFRTDSIKEHTAQTPESVEVA